jgi:hypothetical protein
MAPRKLILRMLSPQGARVHVYKPGYEANGVG